jgi:hypothetical protein
LDAWYIRARREAGLPRVPTESDVERLRRERYRDPDPEMDAALQRLRQVLDGMPVRRCGWHHENGTIHVRIRPYRKRYVEPIRAACLPFASAVTPSPRDD